MSSFREKFMSWFPTSSLEKRDSTDPDATVPASGATNSSLLQYYTEKTNVSHKRSDVYEDMDDLDDEIIARALDMEADDATQMDLQKNKSVWVTSNDVEKKQIIENMFNRIQLEQRIWLWTRDTNKYGDFFIRQSVHPKEGIKSVQDTYHPKEVVRLEDKGKLVGFLYLDRTNQSMKPHKPHEWIHFRNIKHRVEDDLMPNEFYKKYQVDKNARYGSPTFINARRVEKQLRLAEDSLVLGRLAKSQYTQIHYVKVGDAGTKEQKNIVDNYEQLFTRDKKKDYKNDTFTSEHSSFSIADRVFVPVRNQDKGRSQVEEVGGNLDVTAIADIEMLNNKRFGALGIPKEYMSYESNLSFNTLMQLDPRYARKVANHQRNMIVGLTLMAQIELAIHGLNPDPKGFTINMTSVSSTEQLERTDSLNALLDAGDRMVRFFQDIKGEIDKKYLYRYIVNTYLNLPDINLDRLFQQEGIEPSQNGNGSTDFDSPEGRKELFDMVQKACKEDPKIVKLLNEFLGSVYAKEGDRMLEQRIAGETYSQSELDEMLDKDGKSFVEVREGMESEEESEGKSEEEE